MRCKATEVADLGKLSRTHEVHLILCRYSSLSMLAFSGVYPGGRAVESFHLLCTILPGHSCDRRSLSGHVCFPQDQAQVQRDPDPWGMGLYGHDPLGSMGHFQQNVVYETGQAPSFMFYTLLGISPGHY